MYFRRNHRGAKFLNLSLYIILSYTKIKHFSSLATVPSLLDLTLYETTRHTLFVAALKRRAIYLMDQTVVPSRFSQHMSGLHLVSVQIFFENCIPQYTGQIFEIFVKIY